MIYYHADQRVELFNVAEDIGETENLFEMHKEKAEELAQNLTDYLKSTNAQMPKNKETGEVIPFPDHLFEAEINEEK